MTPEIVETLTKSHVLLPTRVDDLIERLRAITEIASMLWGEDTRIPQKLVPFVNWLDSNKLTVTSREASQPEYIAKVMKNLVTMLKCFHDIINSTSLRNTRKF